MEERERARGRDRLTDKIMSAKLAVVLGSLLGSHNERSQTGERLRHLQELMLREEKEERKREEGSGRERRETRRGGRGPGRRREDGEGK